MTHITSKGWTLDSLLATGSNLKAATIVDATSLPRNELAQTVNEALDAGLPVIITGGEPNDEEDALFSLKSIRRDFRGLPAHATAHAINVVNGKHTTEFSASHILEKSVHMSAFAKQDEHVRYYAMDISPPGSWKRWLNAVPSKTAVLTDDFLPLGNDDLFAHLPDGAQPESLLCYFGSGDTYTTWCKDACGSISQNIMCHAAPNASAFWFMISGSDADKASTYFHERGRELDSSDPAPFSLPQDIKDMPFEVFVCQQRRGDLVILPPRCTHQVIHHGGFSGSMAWSRMTISSVAHALHLELPIYNRLARPETYRVKLTLWHATLYEAQRSSPDKALLEELIALLDQVIVSEWMPAVYDLKPSVIFGEDFLSCDYCAADIFVAYFECEDCGKQREDAVVLCSLCYASGRTCECVDGMVPCVTVPFREIVDKRNGCAEVLTNLGVRTPRVTERSIKESKAPKTFESACAIQRRRRETGQSTVTCPFDEWHSEATAAAIKCDTTDGPVFFCYRHLLDTPAAMHSARAAGLSSEDTGDAMCTGGLEADGNYLSAVVRKYPKASCADEGSTRRGWYDGDEEEHHADRAGAHDRITARIEEEIREIIRSIRKPPPALSSSAAQPFASVESDLSSSHTQPSPLSFTVVERDHLPIVLPAASDESPPRPSVDVVELQAAPVSTAPPQVASRPASPAAPSTAPHEAAAGTALDGGLHSNGNGKKLPVRSRKRSSLVIPSGHESDSSLDEDEPPRRPPAKKQPHIRAKRSRLDVRSDTNAPVAKRRKVADSVDIDISSSRPQTQTLSAAERLALAFSQRSASSMHSSSTAVAPSTPAAGASATSTTPATKTSRESRVHRRMAPATPWSSASTPSPALPLTADDTPARPSIGHDMLVEDDDRNYRSSTLVPSTAPSTPARVITQPGTPFARAHVEARPSAAAMDAISVDSAVHSSTVASASELNSGAVPKVASTATHPTAAFIPVGQQSPITAYSAIAPDFTKFQPPFPSFKKKRSIEDVLAGETPPTRPLKQTRMDASPLAVTINNTCTVVERPADDAGQLAGVLKHAFDALVRRPEVEQDGLRAQMTLLRDSFDRLQSRCANLEAQLDSTRQDLATTRQDLDAARRDNVRLMSEKVQQAQEQIVVHATMPAPLPPWRANPQSNYVWQGHAQQYYQGPPRQVLHNNSRNYQHNWSSNRRMFDPPHDGRAPLGPPEASLRGGNAEGRMAWRPGFVDTVREGRMTNTGNVTCSGHAQADAAAYQRDAEPRSSPRQIEDPSYDRNRARRYSDARAVPPQSTRKAHGHSPSRGRTRHRTPPRSEARSRSYDRKSPRRRDLTPAVHSRPPSPSPRQSYARSRSRSRSPSRRPSSRSPSRSGTRSHQSNSRSPSPSYSRRRRSWSRSRSRSRSRPRRRCSSCDSRSPPTATARRASLADHAVESPSLSDRIQPREGSITSVRIGGYSISRRRQNSSSS